MLVLIAQKQRFFKEMDTNDKSKIIVSVVCATFNHENYIKACLDGFLIQQTNFKFEILIHDDASTDATASIIKTYEEKHPNLIKPIYQTENQYSKGVHITNTFIYPIAKGKYIAMCEGDDYWTDPLKLQKQVDFLEENEDYGLVCTNLVNYKQKTNQFYDSTIVPFDTYGYEDVMNWRNQVWTLTVCYRKGLLRNIPELDASKYFYGDRVLFFHLSLQSKVKFINEKTAVYRVLEESASHFRSKFKSIEFAYKVANTSLYFLNKFPVNKELHVYLKFKNMLAIFKYAIATKNHKLFKTIELELPKGITLKNQLIRILYILSKFKPFFLSYASVIKIR